MKSVKKPKQTKQTRKTKEDFLRWLRKQKALKKQTVKDEGNMLNQPTLPPKCLSAFGRGTGLTVQ